MLACLNKKPRSCGVFYCLTRILTKQNNREKTQPGHYDKRHNNGQWQIGFAKHLIH
jgi:hypothetical protein